MELYSSLQGEETNKLKVDFFLARAQNGFQEIFYLCTDIFVDGHLAYDYIAAG